MTGELLQRLCLFILLGLTPAMLLGCKGGDEAKDLAVSITSPTDKTYVRNTLTIQVLVSGGTPDAVELLKDGAPLVKLVAPYQYAWDTSSVPEGEYALSARATLGEASVSTQPIQVVVDRTPPGITSRTPDPQSAAEWSGPISFTASEVLAPATVNDNSVLLFAGGAGVPKRLVLSPDGKTVQMLLTEPLNLPVGMTVVIGPTVTDLAGNPLVGSTSTWSWDAEQWRPLGASMHPPGTAADYIHSSIVLDASGRPVVSYGELSGQPVNTKSIVARWNGGAWERITPADANSQLRLAVDAARNVYLAQGTYFDMSVRKREGEEWKAVGPVLPRTPGSIDQGLRFAVTSAGVPLVGWHDRDAEGNNQKVRIYILEGTAWKSLGEFADSRLHVLAVDAADRPWMAYTRLFTRETRVMRWDGTAWQQVGPLLQATVNIDHPAEALDLQFDPAGVPFITWRTGSRLYVQKWTGTSWTLLGDWAAGFGVSSEEEVALALAPGSRPIVAWILRPASTEAELRVDAWSETGWSSLLRAAANVYNGPSLAVDAAGRPVVVWHSPGASHDRPILKARSNR